MDIILSSSLSSPILDTVLRVGDFTLLPNNSVLPVVKSQPERNIYQKTWIKSVVNGKTAYQKINPASGVYRMVEGTKIGWSVFAADPSNNDNPNSDSNLSFYWRKDGTPLADLNLLNEAKGSKSILFNENECTLDKTGRYVCEISNQFGTIETAPLDIQVLRLSQYPRLFTNLVVNGNADSQTDGWTIDEDILSRNFAKDWICINGQSLPNLSYLFDSEADDTVFEQKELLPFFEFAFNQSAISSTNQLLLPWIQKGPDWLSVVPGWMSEKPDQPESDENPLAGWARWVLTGATPQIIDNETPGEDAFGGFFPAMKYIDSYNRNQGQGVIGLYQESKDQRLSYFTRDKLKFTKFGGKASSRLSQTIDLSDLADFVDGNVFGVDYLSSHFFAYIGAGITRYKIRAEVSDSDRERFSNLFNWFAVDYEEFLNRLKNDNSSVKKVLLPNTPIDIMPLTEDITKVRIEYLNDQENILLTDTINGPEARDVFAIKDKTLFPLTLYPLFEFFVQNNNPIRVFGQTYTNTEALAPLFENATPYPFSWDQFSDGDSPELRFAGWQGNQEKLDRVLDPQAKFGLTKLNFVRFGSWPNNTRFKLNRQRRAVQESGAAAMFGAEKTRIIPKGTRSVRLTVTFSHTSDVILDNNPKAKKWSEQTIYLDSYGQSSGTSARVVDYSYPKCGITKIKFLVVPNNFSVSNQYASYKLPPFQNTVVGYRKQLLSRNVHDSSTRTEFEVDTATGKFALAAALPPTTSSPFITDIQNQYIMSGQQQRNTEQTNQANLTSNAADRSEQQETFDSDAAEARNDG